MTRIFVIIPAYNRRETTLACLRCLENQTFDNRQIVVVDDGSTDGTGEAIAEQFPSVKVLTGDGNLWWTGAMNKGVHYALSICNPNDFILVLNDDVTISKDYLSTFSELGKAFKDTLIGSVVIDSSSNVILDGGIHINWLTAKVSNLNCGKKLSDLPKGYFEDVSTLTGRGIFIPVKVFHDIGLYDDKHFMQCGDTEFPKRAEKAGYRLIVSYNAVVYNNDAEENHINHMCTYLLADIKSYYWGIRSNMNLRYRFWFADQVPDLL